MTDRVRATFDPDGVTSATLNLKACGSPWERAKQTQTTSSTGGVIVAPCGCLWGQSPRPSLGVKHNQPMSSETYKFSKTAYSFEDQLSSLERSHVRDELEKIDGIGSSYSYEIAHNLDDLIRLNVETGTIDHVRIHKSGLSYSAESEAEEFIARFARSEYDHKDKNLRIDPTDMGVMPTYTAVKRFVDVYNEGYDLHSVDLDGERGNRVTALFRRESEDGTDYKEVAGELKRVRQFKDTVDEYGDE